MSTSAAYSLIMLIAIVSGGLILRGAQRTLPVSSDQRIAIGLAAFCGAMLGAKLPFLIADWSSLLNGAIWLSSGKTILCGLVGAYAGVEVTKWLLHIRVKTGDTFVVAAAVAVAIGRLGRLLAGCCYGSPTDLPWGLRCAIIDDLPRHPTQIYEAVFHGSAAAIMFYLQRHSIWKGQLAKFYILSYCVYRFASEYVRPEAEFAAGLTGYQWFALACVPVFSFLWWRDTVLKLGLPEKLPPLSAAIASPPRPDNVPNE
jgi:phosphatidylglycerol:prolipoprotein diacylglycerol transferase